MVGLPAVHEIIVTSRLAWKKAEHVGRYGVNMERRPVARRQSIVALHFVDGSEA